MLPCGPRGPQGCQGDRGPPGDQGLPGRPGVQGCPGEKGDPGQQGSPGVPGTGGTQGNPGEQGMQGNPGMQGAPGEQGSPGMQGNVGVQGMQGDQGLPGDQGNPGVQGAPGEQGSPGEQGMSGGQGVPGEAGDQGSPGDQGNPGVQGQQGSPGDQGSPGSPGVQGPPGVPGLGVPKLATPDVPVAEGFLYELTFGGANTPLLCFTISVSDQSNPRAVLYVHISGTAIYSGPPGTDMTGYFTLQVDYGAWRPTQYLQVPVMLFSKPPPGNLTPRIYLVNGATAFLIDNLPLSPVVISVSITGTMISSGTAIYQVLDANTDGLGGALEYF